MATGFSFIIPQRQPPKYNWNRATAERICEIGKGGQGKCWLVRQVGEGELAVIKTLSNERSKKTNKAKAAEESRILGQILPHSDKIVEYYMASMDPYETHLYLEYCDGGDLQSLIDIYRKASVYIPESFIWNCFVQLTEALAWIHYGISKTQREPSNWERVIHRDIKPANVFLKRTGFDGLLYPDIKLGDFGLAAVTSDPGHTADYKYGTYQWQPPERPEATAKGDVWSLGAIIHALGHEGKPPIAPLPSTWQDDHSNRRRWRRHPQARRPVQLPSEYSGRLEDWMLATLKIDPLDRISSRALFQEMLPRYNRFVSTQWHPLNTWNRAMEKKDPKRRANSDTSMAMSLGSSTPFSEYIEFLV